MADRSREQQWRAAHEVVTGSDLPLLHRHDLVGVAVGIKTTAGQATGQPCVTAFVREKLPRARLSRERLVPETIEGPTDVVVTDVETMETPTAPPWRLDPSGMREARLSGPRLRERPVRGGDSIAHFRSPLGTAGIVIRDPDDPVRRLVLSCNHVLAELNRGRLGDPVLQPAGGDGGRLPLDVCGTLHRFVPVSFGPGGANRVDAAAARVSDGVPLIEWVGPLRGVRQVEEGLIGESVFKVGRTTGLTRGIVQAVHFTGWIPYPPLLGGGVALFREQVVTTPMAAFGDSGAVLCDAAVNGLGLLFGGSPTHTLYNSLQHVLDDLAVTSGHAADRAASWAAARIEWEGSASE
jgi:hypothetical protein